MVLCGILYLAKTGQKHAHNRQKNKTKMWVLNKGNNEKQK